MKVLVTGAKGFVGKNFVETLKCIRDGKKRDTSINIDEIYEYDKENSASDLKEFCTDCDFVFNLAGVNRPKDENEFHEGNFGFASDLLDNLKACGNKCPVMLSSSIQASLVGRFENSPYGKSKLEGENLFFEYGIETGSRVLVYRFPNLFGKWCRPNYNSAVATFCNAVANGLSYHVDDRNTQLELLYIDDLINEMLRALNGEEHHCDYEGTKPIAAEGGKFCFAPITHKVTLGHIVDLLESFSRQPESLIFDSIPDGSFEKKLYSTYLSYLPIEKTVISLRGAEDERGSFTEFFRNKDVGQFSINISKPGKVKGQHWHHTKMEIFLVVSGHGLIQERQVGTDENGNLYPIREFEVYGDKLQCVYMLPGYTHNITNLSDTQDLVTVMWANEVFDSNHPETYREDVVLRNTLLR